MRTKLFIVLVLCCFLLVACDFLQSDETPANVYYIDLENEALDCGKIRADKDTVTEGDCVTLTILPIDDNFLLSLKVNGEEMKDNVVDNTLVLQGITSDVQISYRFGVGVAYVSAEEAPVIDGEIDDIWENVPTFKAQNVFPDKGDVSQAHKAPEIKVMWNETGFYYLAVVYDDSVTDLDRCNFWVSEVHTVINAPYSANPDDGNYAMCVNPKGVNLPYLDLDVSQFWTVGAEEFDAGYIVEVFMPVIGQKPLKAGNSMGLDISVDYLSLSEQRDYYVNWYGLGGRHFAKYWDNPSALREVVLLPR